MLQEQVRVEELEELDDLELLSQGDAVSIIYQYRPLWKNDEQKQIGAYHKISEFGLLEFLIPANMGEDYIIMYRARKDRIEIRKGSIIIDEDASVTESFNQKNSKYPALNNTLQKAGLRE